MRASAAAIVAGAAVLVASGCAGSGPRLTAHYTTPPETTAGLSLESPRVQQIRLARASNPRIFSIFPAVPGRKTCGIPAGGAHRKPLLLPATCETSIRSAATHEPALVVTFTERWRFPPCPRGADCLNRLLLHSTWQVVERVPMVTTTSGLRVIATRTSGATPPQYWK